MNIFIIGGTGFLGYHAAQDFLCRGHTVTLLGLPPIPQDEFFINKVRLVIQDLEQTSDEELCTLMTGHDALVFTADMDDRTVLMKPAYPFLQHANVEAPKRILSIAKRAGVRRVVILGSYFVYFNRLWPELKLAQHHPYIRSRQEQEDVCLALSVPGFDVMVLELPYIFGSMPGRKPLWTPLIKYILSMNPFFYMRGGSTCVAAQTVADAIVGAIESGCGGHAYPIGDENLTWVEMLTRLARAGGKHVNILTIPTWILSIASWNIWLYRKLLGKEGGLDMRYFAVLQTAKMFIDSLPSQASLGFHTRGLEQAFKDTVSAAVGENK